MRMAFMTTCAGLLIGSSGLPLAAQACLGAAPWHAGSTQVGVLGKWSSAGSGFGARAAAGRDIRAGRAIFVQAAGARVTPARDDDLIAAGGAANPEYSALGELGLELPFGRSSRATVCPTVGLGFVSGPETLTPDRASVPPGELERERAGPLFIAGAWAGVPPRNRGAIRVYPALGAHLVHQRLIETAEGSREGVPVDESTSRNTTAVQLSFAVGFGAGTRIHLRPRVSVRIGGGGPTAEMEALASVSFSG